MAKQQLRITALLFLGIFFSGAMTVNAQTGCFNTPLDGTWADTGAVKNGLSRLLIVRECTQEESEDGLIVPGSRWYVRAWSKCYPRHCAWGRVRAKIGPQGNLRASLPTYSADRFLSVKYAGGAIQVHLIVDYHDKRRRDRDEKVRLTRQD